MRVRLLVRQRCLYVMDIHAITTYGTSIAIPRLRMAMNELFRLLYCSSKQYKAHVPKIAVAALPCAALCRSR